MIVKVTMPSPDDASATAHVCDKEGKLRMSVPAGHLLRRWSPQDGYVLYFNATVFSGTGKDEKTGESVGLPTFVLEIGDRVDVGLDGGW